MITEKRGCAFTMRNLTTWIATSSLIVNLIAADFGCTPKIPNTKGIYMLLDTSGTYALELNKANAIISYLLGTLQPGDTLAVGRIDTGSFSEKDIIAKVTFDQRPSMANNQKRAFKQKMDNFISKVKGSNYTDISGGILQAVEYLNEVGSQNKYILIFSDLKEELAKGHVRDVPFRLSGFEIIALNVTKLNEDIRNPQVYIKRVAHWQAKTEEGEGTFRVINDLERLDAIFSR
jgi:hypothetical protein